MNSLIKAEVSLSVHFFDVDPMNVVWHGNYPRFLEIARVELMKILKYGYEEMKSSGYMWPIVDMRIRYVRPIFLNQRILVEAHLTEYENRFVTEYRIYDEETHSLLTKASTVQVAVKEGNTSMEMESPSIFVDRVKRALSCA